MIIQIKRKKDDAMREGMYGAYTSSVNGVQPEDRFGQASLEVPFHIGMPTHAIAPVPALKKRPEAQSVEAAILMAPLSEAVDIVDVTLPSDQNIL